MEISRPFRLGFMGTTTDEVLYWAADEVVGNYIYMPFTGSGKDISWLSNEDRVIYSADTQYLSKLMVDGIFNSVGGGIVLGELPEEEGYACANPPFKRMDDPYVLRVIDGLCIYGSEFDKAVICKAMLQSTIGGRLTHWDITTEKFVEKIRRIAEAYMEYTNLAGTRHHFHSSCFDLDIAGPIFIDTIWIDPPKVIDTQDAYSKMFVKLNSVLEQKDVELPKWKHHMMIPNLRKLWDLPCKRIIQFYCSDVRPTDNEVRAALEQYGKVQERKRFLHGAKADYIHILDKD